jgi:hypothetical protein
MQGYQTVHQVSEKTACVMHGIRTTDEVPGVNRSLLFMHARACDENTRQLSRYAYLANVFIAVLNTR